MLTESQRITLEITKAKVELGKVDADIEEREERLSKLRQYREQKYRWLTTLEGQLQRAEAPLRKPVGPCVTIDGWDV